MLPAIVLPHGTTGKADIASRCRPGVIDPGRVIDQTFCLTGVMATCAAIVDFDLPNDAEDSFNFLPESAPDAPGQLDNLEHPEIVKELKLQLEIFRATGRSERERQCR